MPPKVRRLHNHTRFAGVALPDLALLAAERLETAANSRASSLTLQIAFELERLLFASSY
ncbi:hypothetical protein IFR05_017110, partial [Cadophora sp. M221]